MKHKHFNRLLSMLLVVATLFGILAVPASAATLDNSGTVTIQQAGFGKYPGNHQRKLHQRRLLEVHQQRICWGKFSLTGACRPYDPAK